VGSPARGCIVHNVGGRRGAVVVASALGFSYPLPLAVRDGAAESKDGMAEQSKREDRPC
jgi:hypothetical protein